jgi:hypothetical protein
MVRPLRYEVPGTVQVERPLRSTMAPLLITGDAALATSPRSWSLAELIGLTR